MKEITSPKYEYSVSICVMTKGTNPMGHSYLMINQIDKNDLNAKVEVIESIGFYSRYTPWLPGGFKYISRGRVKTEEAKDIVGKPGMYHRSFKIEPEDLAVLLVSINADRRLFNKDDKQLKKDGTPETKPGGPRFNLFTGRNCKSYALEKVEELGIDVKSMHQSLELPRFTPHVHPLKIAQDAPTKKIVWDCPLTLSPRTDEESAKTPEVKLSQKFNALTEGVDNILSLLQGRSSALKKQGREVAEINTALSNMQKIKEAIKKIEPYPNQINDVKIESFKENIRTVVLDCTNSLKAKGIEKTLRHLLLDSLKEMCSKIAYGWTGMKLFQNNANALDNRVLLKVDEIQNGIKNLKIV